MIQIKGEITPITVIDEKEKEEKDKEESEVK
jgi:hypothetical protein